MRSLIRSLCLSLEYSMDLKLLIKHHLEFLSLKGGYTCSSESTLVKKPHCWKSHVTAQIYLLFCDKQYIHNDMSCDTWFPTSVNSDEPVQLPFKLRNIKWWSVGSLTLNRIFKRQAKALIRLPVWAGWSEALMVAHTTLLEIPCSRSYLFYSNKVFIDFKC